MVSLTSCALSSNMRRACLVMVMVHSIRYGRLVCEVMNNMSLGIYLIVITEEITVKESDGYKYSMYLFLSRVYCIWKFVCVVFPYFLYLDIVLPHTTIYVQEGPVLPVLLIACNRESAVRRSLDLLLKYRPSQERFPIIVSQDCGHRPTREAIESYGDKVTLIQVAILFRKL